MELHRQSKATLLLKCQELGIEKCKSKTKSELIQALTTHLSPSIHVCEEERKVTEPKPYALVDLFCGTGAFSHAFHATNQVDTVFANDLLDSSEEIFNLNYDLRLTKQNLLEVKEEDVPKHDILTAGFPCQPFSIAGMQRGFEDERSNVFWKILSIIQRHSPRVVVLENVKNLQSHDEGRTFQTIVQSLEQLQYHIKYAVLNTSKVTGIPQNRERIYLVCFLDKTLHDLFDFDFPDQPLQPLTDFLEPEVPDKYYYKETGTIYPALQSQVTRHIATNTVYQYRRYYVRENKNQVCPTLTANMGGGGHNVPIILDDRGIRKLTPRECFNLQGFSKQYRLPHLSDSKLYALAGNAVSVPVVELIAKKIVALM